MFRMKTLLSWLLLVAELEHVSSLMRPPFVKTTPRRTGGGFPGFKTSAPLVDHHQHPAASLTIPATAVFGILPSHNIEDWQLLLLSFQDNLGGQHDPLTAFTGSLLSQTQAVLQDGIQQASASLSQVQDELTTVAYSLQTGLQEQLSGLENIQSSTQDQISTLTGSVHGQALELSSTVQEQVSALSTTVEGQVSTLSTTADELSTSLQSGFVAQWGALTLLWSDLQSSLTFNVQDQASTLQSQLAEQLVGLALILKNAEASTAALWQDETLTLFQLLPGIEEQVSGWTGQQQQALKTWLSSIGQGASFTGADWSAILSQWQGQLSNANEVVKTVVTGMGLVLGAYFVFGPQPDEANHSKGATTVAMPVAASEKSQLDLVLEQVSMVEKEHEELEQAIWQGSPPPTIMATAGSAALLDKPFFVEDKSNVPEKMPIPPPSSETNVIQTYYSSTANYLGSSTVVKKVDINDDAIILHFDTATEQEELELSSISLDNAKPTPTIAMENDEEPLTEITMDTTALVTLPLTEAGNFPVEPVLALETTAQNVSPVLALETTAQSVSPVLALETTAQSVSPAVSYLESLSSNSPAASSQSYLDSLAKAQRPSVQSYLDSLSKVQRLPSPSYLDSLANFERPQRSVVTEFGAEIPAVPELPVDVVDTTAYPMNADGTKDWPLEVFASKMSDPALPPLTNADASEVPEPVVVTSEALTEDVLLVDENPIDPVAFDVLASAKDVEQPLDTLLPTKEIVASFSAEPIEATSDVHLSSPVTEATEESDWAVLSNGISPDIWNQADLADDSVDTTASEEMLTLEPYLSASSNDDLDWAGLSDEISSDIWNQDAEVGRDDSIASDSPLPVTGSGEPWSAAHDERSSDVWSQGNQSKEATPRVPITALLSDEDNEIREYINAKAAQKTRERLQEQVARRTSTVVSGSEEVVVNIAQYADAAIETAEVNQIEDVVEDSFIDVAPSIEARSETIALKISKNEIDETYPVADLLDVAPRRHQRLIKSKPKISKKRLLTAVAVVAVVVGQRALTTILNRSLL